MKKDSKDTKPKPVAGLKAFFTVIPSANNIKQVSDERDAVLETPVEASVPAKVTPDQAAVVLDSVTPKETTVDLTIEAKPVHVETKTEAQTNKPVFPLFAKKTPAKAAKEETPVAPTPTIIEITESDEESPSKVEVVSVMGEDEVVSVEVDQEEEQVAMQAEGDEQQNSATDNTQPETENGVRRSGRLRNKPQLFTFKDPDSDDDFGEADKEKRLQLQQERKKRKEQKEAEEREAKKVKKAAIFQSREEKARLAAEEKERKAKQEEEERQAKLRQEQFEREQRIQASMLKTKAENDKMLHATSNNENVNAFFAAKISSKPNAQSICEVGVSGVAEGEGLSESMIALPPSQIGYSLAEYKSIAQTLPDRPITMSTVNDGDAVDGTVSLLTPPLVDAVDNDGVSLRSLWMNYATTAINTMSLAPTLTDHRTAVESATLHAWLATWTTTISQYKHGGSARASELGSEIVDSDEEYSFRDAKHDATADGGVYLEGAKVFIVEGESGSGKTSLVHALAKEYELGVVEISASTCRSATLVKRLLSETAQSRSVTGYDEVTVGSKGSLLLFDDADVVLEKDEMTFHNALHRLAHTSKYPIVITAENIPSALLAMPFDYLHLARSSPSQCAESLLAMLQLTSEADRDKVKGLLTCLAILTQSDLRACLQALLLPRSSVPGTETMSLGRYCASKGQVFGCFDALLASLPHKQTTSVATLAKVYVPIIHKVTPRVIDVSLGGTLQVRGRNFLQACNIYGDSKDSLAAVEVTIGDIVCAAKVSFDSLITVDIPPHALPCGTLPVHVTLIFTGGNSSNKVKVTSAMCGQGGSWIVAVPSNQALDLTKHLNNLCKGYQLYRSAIVSAFSNAVVKSDPISEEAVSNKKMSARKESRLHRRTERIESDDEDDDAMVCDDNNTEDERNNKKRQRLEDDEEEVVDLVEESEKNADEKASDEGTLDISTDAVVPDEAQPPSEIASEDKMEVDTIATDPADPVVYSNNVSSEVISSNIAGAGNVNVKIAQAETERQAHDTAKHTYTLPPGLEYGDTQGRNAMLSYGITSDFDLESVCHTVDRMGDWDVLDTHRQACLDDDDNIDEESCVIGSKDSGAVSLRRWEGMVSGIGDLITKSCDISSYDTETVNGSSPFQTAVAALGSSFLAADYCEKRFRYTSTYLLDKKINAKIVSSDSVRHTDHVPFLCLLTRLCRSAEEREHAAQYSTATGRRRLQTGRRAAAVERHNVMRQKLLCDEEDAEVFFNLTHSFG